jgi:hypothetical protein
MSKFGGLALNVTSPSRMTIVHPGTKRPIIANTGEAAFVDLLPLDSEAGQQFIRGMAAAQNARARDNVTERDAFDPLATAIEALSVLATGWLLVDPVTREVIDFPFGGPATARELFGAPEMIWLCRYAYNWVSNESNFMPALPAS